MRVIRIFFLLITLFAIMIFILPEPEGFPILEYHQITDNPEEGFEVYSVPPAEFAAQLDYLQEKGYTTITLQDFMRVLHGKGTLPDKPIILTFDDGYEDNYTEMLPILEAHNMKAVVYVITNNIGKPGFLTLEQIKDMQNRGIEIGSHTADHLSLKNLDDALRRYEIRDSKIFLEWSGLKTIYSFSYPNGDYTSEMIDILKGEEYLSAVTGDVGLNHIKTNPLLLKRVHIRKPTFGIMEFRWRLLKAKIFAKFRN